MKKILEITELPLAIVDISVDPILKDEVSHQLNYPLFPQLYMGEQWFRAGGTEGDFHKFYFSGTYHDIMLNLWKDIRADEENKMEVPKFYKKKMMDLALKRSRYNEE